MAVNTLNTRIIWLKQDKSGTYITMSTTYPTIQFNYKTRPISNKFDLEISPDERFIAVYEKKSTEVAFFEIESLDHLFDIENFDLDQAI